MSLEKQIEFWLVSAERNWQTAQSLFELKHYDACLFYCHLTLEKLLKALVVEKTDKAAPFGHDLEKLSLLAGLKPAAEQIDNLRTITTFNMSARYDEAKQSFYKKCTPEYT